LIIMDLTIPGAMGGKDAIKKILEINPDAKVLVSSGYSNDPVMSDYRKYGFVGAVAKPFLSDDLKRTIYNVLRTDDA
jgi:two-component system, cell cycle sensor histidine kinase and response regulator CckA